MKKLFTLLFTTISLLSIAQTESSILPYTFTGRYHAPYQEVTTPSIDVDMLKAEDEYNKANNKHLANRFGYEHIVSYNFNNSGTWTTNEDGSRVWRMGITCEDALSINLIFDQFYLANGATLHFYTKDESQVVGAYTSSNNNIK